MTETSKAPTLILRAVRRTPDGAEEIDEREVHCETSEELYALLRRTPQVDLEPPDADQVGAKWEETVGALQTWLTSLKLVLEQTETGDGMRRWTFCWQPNRTAAQGTTEPSRPAGEAIPDPRVAVESDPALEVSGLVEAAIHTGPEGDVLVARRAGQNVQMLNTGLCTWQTNNLVCQMQMHVNFVVKEAHKLPGEHE